MKKQNRSKHGNQVVAVSRLATEGIGHTAMRLHASPSNHANDRGRAMLFRIFPFALLLMILGWWFSPTNRYGKAEAACATAVQDSGETEKPAISNEMLRGKRFKFSWKSSGGGGLNGIATLNADGTIAGIGSPNESTWNVDEAGKLLFQHANGQVSTRFLQASLAEGVLCFEGPFLLRDGIDHFLVEVNGNDSEEQQSISGDQARKIKYSSQQFVYLDLDERVVFRLRSGTAKTIQLKSVEEYKDSVIDLVRSARVVVDIDGKQLTLSCTPYVMPTEFEGLRIQADTTSAWMNIPKRVQFSLWDATDSIVDTNLFCFPLPDYRLLSLGMQAYNEPVHLGDRDGDPEGQRFYHNYGVDLAGYDGRQKVVSCIEGVVVQVQRQEGTLAIQDDRGFILMYGHLDAILSDITVGTRVERGQWVAMLGRRGASGNFSHLHMGSYLSEQAMMADRMSRNLNLYPWLVAAYRVTCGTSLFAVARPHHTVRIGETVAFDAANSFAHGSKITSFCWEFHDGEHIDGPTAEKTYNKPGCYMATLWVKDADNRVDADFCRVKVFSDSVTEPVMPTLFVTCKPAGLARVGQGVSFRIWPQGDHVAAIQVDFGDGGQLADYRPETAITHTFTKPGVHIVTVSGTSGTCPVTQKVKVIVQE